MFFTGKLWSVLGRIVLGTAAATATATVTHKLTDKGTDATLRGVRWVFMSKDEKEYHNKVESEIRARVIAEHQRKLGS